MFQTTNQPWLVEVRPQIPLDPPATRHHEVPQVCRVCVAFSANCQATPSYSKAPVKRRSARVRYFHYYICAVDVYTRCNMQCIAIISVCVYIDIYNYPHNISFSLWLMTKSTDTIKVSHPFGQGTKRYWNCCSVPVPFHLRRMRPWVLGLLDCSISSKIDIPKYMGI